MEIQLDKHQQAVVESDASNICVIAGAGAGKTACLVARVRRLLEEGKDASKFVCITFTTMAAQEMRQRLKEFNIDNMFIGTIHSYAFQLLRRNNIRKELLTPTTEYSIAQQLVSKYCKHLSPSKFEEWCRLRRLKEKGYVTSSEMWSVLNKEEKDDLLGIFDTLDSHCIDKSSCDNLDDIAKNALKQEKTARTSSEYPETVTSVANRMGLITFNALLDMCTNNSSIPPIEYLFVDEFQDVGVFEYRFITALDAKNRFYVGDDWQSLYSFKGADFEYFKSISKSPEFITFKLENNYRSSSKIVQAANDIISNIHDVIPKKCVSKVKYLTNTAPIHEQGSASKVLEYLHNIDCRDYGKWFILVRTNNDAIKISRLCYHAGIPTTSFKKGAINAQEMNEALEDNSIKILTIHTAKGLESDNVIIWSDVPDKDEIANYYDGINHTTEECRVYYVAATRARKNLIVIHKPRYDSQKAVDYTI